MKDRLRETPELETDRLILRKFNLDDAQDVFAYASNPEVARYVTWDAHATIENSIAFINWVLERYNAGRTSDWAIVLKETGQVVGSIGLVEMDDKNARCEVGYVIAQPIWGRGLMPEALRRVVRFLLEEGGVNRVEAIHVLENEASGKVMEKVGMTFEGILKQRIQAKGQFWDVKQYSIIKSDWKRQQAEKNLKDGRIQIELADEEDLAEILHIQKLAYASEAALYKENIPPMTETMDDMREDFKKYKYLKAELDGVVIGAVRGKVQDGTCYIGRLIVHPDYQKHGIGTSLIRKIESVLPESRYELFTGHLSTRNIALYEKNGYVQYQAIRVSDHLTHVYMEKRK